MKVGRGLKSLGVEEFYFFFFSLLLFSSACHAGMLEAFLGEGALRGPYRLSDTCYGIVKGNMDTSRTKDDEWCLDHWAAKETAETTVLDYW